MSLPGGGFRQWGDEWSRKRASQSSQSSTFYLKRCWWKRFGHQTYMTNTSKKDCSETENDIRSQENESIKSIITIISLKIFAMLAHRCSCRASWASCKASQQWGTAPCGTSWLQIWTGFIQVHKSCWFGWIPTFLQNAACSGRTSPSLQCNPAGHISVNSVTKLKFYWMFKVIYII